MSLESHSPDSRCFLPKHQAVEVAILAPPVSCVTLGKTLQLSEPQFL